MQILFFGSMLGWWQVRYLLVGDLALRSPLNTVDQALKLVWSDEFSATLSETMTAFAIALAIAVVLGVSLGFGLGMNRLAAEVGEPLLVSFYSLPKINLYPIILLVFGLGMSSKIAFGAIHGILPIAIFTL